MGEARGPEWRSRMTLEQSPEEDGKVAANTDGNLSGNEMRRLGLGPRGILTV